MGRLLAHVLICEVVTMFGRSFKKKPGGENEGAIHLSVYLRSSRDIAILLEAVLATAAQTPTIWQGVGGRSWRRKTKAVRSLLGCGLRPR